MYLATNPPKRCTVSATHFWYAEMTSRRSSGSMRAESAVEPTRSENITVTWRRSAVSLAASSVARASDSGVGARALAGKEEGGEQLATTPDKSDAKLLQVLRRQPRQDAVVDLIIAECCLILFEAKPPQPTSEIHGAAPRADRCMIPQGTLSV